MTAYWQVFACRSIGAMRERDAINGVSCAMTKPHGAMIALDGVMAGWFSFRPAATAIGSREISPWLDQVHRTVLGDIDVSEESRLVDYLNYSTFLASAAALPNL
jgi:hypothetical protein